MSLKPDTWIRQMASEAGLINPFLPELIRELHGVNILSAGISSYGYDLRLAQDNFRLFSPNTCGEIDPKRFDHNLLFTPALCNADDGSQYYLLPPQSYALGLSLECLQMPSDVTGVAFGKSTYSRSGLHVNTTPIEAGWKGRLVIAMSNLAPYPLRVYVNEGICQVLFLTGTEECETSYEDRAGKYQNQLTLTYAKA
jgi:dCTP deaminase